MADRRSFLRGLTAVSLSGGAGLAAAMAPVIAMPKPPIAPAENPELLKLGVELDKAYAAFQVTEAREREALATFEAVRPPIPEALVLQIGDVKHGLYGENECGTNRERIWHGDPRMPTRTRRLHCVYELERVKAAAHPRSAAGRFVRERLPLAREYEAAVKRAEVESDVGNAIEVNCSTYRVVEQLSEEISATPAVTGAGIVIKARALIAASEGPWGAPQRSPALFGKPLAEAIMQLAGGARG